MILYLVRHGKAEAGDDDAARRLTEAGRKTVGRVARRLEKAGIRIDRIEHSGLVRAMETAKILAEKVGGEVTEARGLGPSDDVATTARRLASEEYESVMLVGHLPYMERLTAYLLTGDEDGLQLHFRTSTIACLSEFGGQWTVEWLLPPDLA